MGCVGVTLSQVPVTAWLRRNHGCGNPSSWPVSTYNPRTVGCPAELTPVGRRSSQCSQLTVDGGMARTLSGQSER